MIYFLLLLSFQFSHAKEKIISLSPAITEIFYELKLENHLIAVSDFSNYPEEAKKLPKVGPYNKPLIEKILFLKPDFIFVTEEAGDDTFRKLDSLHLKYQKITVKKLSDIPKAVTTVAEHFGKQQEAQTFTKKWDDHLKRITKTKSKKIKTIILVQSEPAMVAGDDIFLDEINSFCGGENIYHHLKNYPKVPLESLLKRNPDLVILAEHFNSEAEGPKQVEKWKKYFTQIEIIPPDIIARPGPRLLKGIEMMCRLIKNKSHD